MNDQSPNTNAQTLGIQRAYVRSGTQNVHYRTTGSGPAVVMLHDSPRSSRLHTQTMRALANHFTVYALDTPGYGNSDPLPKKQLAISDFAIALHDTIQSLGLDGAPIYATHTSAKIALEYAANLASHTHLILDGLSIPKSPTSSAFIDAYMRPFQKDDAGGFIANEWTHIRDMLRWFPWFSPSTQNRMQLEVNANWIQEYTIDLFSAGPHYSDAYAAAMRYNPLEALRKIESPTTIGARIDDVLFESLQRIPREENTNLEVAKLPADTSVWLDWIISELKKGTVTPKKQPSSVKKTVGKSVYINSVAGQMHIHQLGEHPTDTILILDTPTLVLGQSWAEQLKEDFHILLPELPGFGESDPFTSPSANAFIDSLTDTLDVLAKDNVTILATGLSAPLAMKLAECSSDKVSSVIVDGGISVAAFPEPIHATDFTPHFDFNYSGSHLHEIWHMLRDSQTNWPWNNRQNTSIRKLTPLIKHENLYDSFMGILKQPKHYADAINTCRELAYSLPKLPHSKMLFLHLDNDPAYIEVEKIASTMHNAILRKRPPCTKDAALIVTNFLEK